MDVVAAAMVVIDIVEEEVDVDIAGNADDTEDTIDAVASSRRGM